MFLGFYNYTVYLTYLNASIGLLGMFFLVLGKFDANGQFDANQFDPNYIKFASICILLSGICDMFDGKVSNFKKKRSIQDKKYGIQIDSLADIISFGILPIFIGYRLFCNTELSKNFNFLCLFIFISICYILTVLIRLAYFNVLAEENYDNKKPKENLNVFLGVPVTLSSIIFPCLILFQNIMMKTRTDVNNIKNIFFTTYLFIMCLLSFLFIFAKIKFPKIKNIIFLIFSCLLSFVIIYYLLQ